MFYSTEDGKLVGCSKSKAALIRDTELKIHKEKLENQHYGLGPRCIPQLSPEASLPLKRRKKDRRALTPDSCWLPVTAPSSSLGVNANSCAPCNIQGLCKSWFVPNKYTVTGKHMRHNSARAKCYLRSYGKALSNELFSTG